MLNCKNLEGIGFCKFKNKNDNDDNDNTGDGLLDILTKFLPKSLRTWIWFDGNWKYSIDTLKKFFESFRERTINEIYFTNCKYITEDHKTIIRKYNNKGIEILYED